MDVRWHPDAREEVRALPIRERAALLNAVAKLNALGLDLPFPHGSAVRGSQTGLRELRPRQGRGPWRALYRRIGDSFVIGAIAPEAKIDRKGFAAALSAAEQRLNDITEE